VTVNENVPSGLIFMSMTGSGWACVGTSCSRSDALSGGSSYPPITVTVNVSAFASSPQVNAVSVSGGNSATANATDSTQISCTYQLTGNGAYSSSSASGAIAIGGLSACGWTASTAASWIHFTSAITGSGNGQITYTIDAN